MSTQMSERKRLNNKVSNAVKIFGLFLLFTLILIWYLNYKGWGLIAINYTLYAMYLYGWPHAITVIAILLICVFRIAIKEWIKKLVIEITSGNSKILAYPVSQDSAPTTAGLRGIVSTDSQLSGTVSIERHSSDVSKNDEQSVNASNEQSEIDELIEAWPELADEIRSSSTKELVDLIPGAFKAKKFESIKQQLLALKYAYVISIRETEFERIYMSIYRSQSVAIRLMSESISGQLPISNLQKTFDETFNRNSNLFETTRYDYNSWLGFMIRNQLITLRTDEMAHIEEKGRMYIRYLMKRNYHLDGPPWNALY